MRRIAAMTMAAALLAGACTSGDGTGNGNGTGNGPVEIPDGPVPTAAAGDFRKGPGDVPVPDRKAVNPGATGGSTEITARVLAAQTEPLGNRPPRPLVLLARSPEEANLIFQKLPRGARDLVIAHTDWQQRSLILFTGGAQPDTSYSVNLRGVGVIGGNKTLQVFGKFKVKKKGAAAQVLSEPWVLATVGAEFAVEVSECLLVYPETAAVQTDCH